MLRCATILCLAWLVGCGGDPAPVQAPDATVGSASVTTTAPATPSEAPTASTQPASSGPKPLPPGVVMLQRMTISDPGVIRAGPALSVLVPAGWRASGGVIAPRDPCSEPFIVEWNAVSPDGRSSVGIVPTETWQSSNTSVQSQCQAGTYATVRDYLAARVQRGVPGARILDFRDRADFARSAIELAQLREQMARQAGISLRVKGEGGEILYAFERDGIDMRGVMGATAVFYFTELANPMGGEPLRSVTGATLGTFTAAAPDGQLDFDLVEASRRSVAPDPAWLDQLVALKVKLGGIAAQGTAELANTIVAGGAAATKANIEAYRRMAQPPASSSGGSGGSTGGGGGELYPGESSGDRMQRESIEAVRGVETYHDPVDNRAVQLDHNYDHAWRVNNQEAYILTKDPNFNPGQYGIEATQMGVVR